MISTIIIPKFQRGMTTQRDKKPHQSWEKKGLKILHFWTPWAIWQRYSQTALASYTKFGIQVIKGQTHLHAKFWVPA